MRPCLGLAEEDKDEEVPGQVETSVGTTGETGRTGRTIRIRI